MSDVTWSAPTALVEDDDPEFARSHERYYVGANGAGLDFLVELLGDGVREVTDLAVNVSTRPTGAAVVERTHDPAVDGDGPLPDLPPDAYPPGATDFPPPDAEHDDEHDDGERREGRGWGPRRPHMTLRFNDDVGLLADGRHAAVDEDLSFSELLRLALREHLDRGEAAGLYSFIRQRSDA